MDHLELSTQTHNFGRFEEVNTQVVVREMWKSGEENGSFKMDFYTLSYGNWKASSRLMFFYDYEKSC